jgi:hypothetical protein
MTGNCGQGLDGELVDGVMHKKAHTIAGNSSNL